MKIEAKTVEEYINGIQPERIVQFKKLREAILNSLPNGFSEELSYGMIGYVVPHSIYPPGYHANPKLPLPFINIASQKNFIAFYHMGIYAIPELLEWFTSEYPKYSKYKPDMGKSCIRFKKINSIPYNLISELVKKISVEEWINVYERNKMK